MRLDNRARMNTPGKAAGNWAWRVGDASVSRILFDKCWRIAACGRGSILRWCQSDALAPTRNGLATHQGLLLRTGLE